MAVVTGSEGVSVEVDFVVESFERCGELVLEDELRRSVTGLGARRTVGTGFVEDDVEDDVVVERFAFVAVVVPIAGAEVDFDVAGEFLAVEFDGGVAKIGTGFKVPPAGEDDFHGAVVGGVEAGMLDALVVPDALDEAFGNGDGDVIVVGVAEDDRGEDGREGLA